MINVTFKGGIMPRRIGAGDEIWGTDLESHLASLKHLAGGRHVGSIAKHPGRRPNAAASIGDGTGAHARDQETE
jgi:hypothetical protein